MGLGLCREAASSKKEAEWSEKLKLLATKQRQILNYIEELRSTSITPNRRNRVKENIDLLRDEINEIVLEASQIAHELGPLWVSATQVQERTLKNRVLTQLKDSKNPSELPIREHLSTIWNDAA